MNNKPRYLIPYGENIKTVSAFIITITFIAISILIFKSEATLIWLIPAALLFALLALLAIDKFLILTVFLVPLSVQLIFIVPESSADIFLPTEVMLAGILLLMIFKLVYSREISMKILVHPVSIISFLILGWCLITSLTSTLPLVSIKSLITRLWFFTGFYLLAAHIFREQNKIRSYFSAYISGMVPVIVFYLVRMWQLGIFNQKLAYKAIRPFFNDHTSFGAALAFCIPVIIYFIAGKKISKMVKIALIFLLAVFSTALVFSYSRAAWLSLAISGLVVAFLMMKISLKIIMPVILAVFIFIFMSWSDVLIKLNENKQDSSDNIGSHLQSISNIRSDASNLERVNRWKSALRMFKEKPVLGWGPATYQFNYAPYQMFSEKTIISTNYGEGGNAHSEYLGALVDSGIPGIVLYILLLIVSIRRGILIWKAHREKQVRYLALALVAGLVTYVIHGGLNNFLDTDKISALFWGMLAAIVAIDIQNEEEKEKIKLSQVRSDN
jgi:putative inorganic carbon (hco3(-)) transporter